MQPDAAASVSAAAPPVVSGSGLPSAEIGSDPGRDASAAPAPAASPGPSADPVLLEVLERNNRLLDAIITRPVEPASTGGARPSLEPDLPAAPPDPVIDPQGHARWVSERISRAERTAERRIAESRAEMENRQAMAELWQDFQREHPDEARLPELVLRALEVETNGTLRIGGDPSALKRRVASRVRERLALVSGSNPGASGSPAASSPAPSNRTAGITGGSSPAAPKAPEKSEEPVKGFADQIKDLQIKSPYF